MKKIIFDRFYLITSVLIFFSSLATLAFLMLVSPGGFDISDEGFHLLASQFPAEVLIWPNVAHIYTGLMFNVVGNNIIGLRILSELLLFASASFFFLGLLKLISVIYPQIIQNASSKMMAWSIMCLGALFYYIHFDITPSYNSLNATLLNTNAGFLCLILSNLSQHTRKIKYLLLNSFLAGLLIGFSFLIKFPTAIALTVLFTIILMSWPLSSKKDKLLSISMLVLGAFTWILFHITFLQPLPSLFHTLHDGVYTFLAYGAHAPTHCFQHSLLETIQMAIQSLKNFWGIYIIFLFGVIISYWKRENYSVKAQSTHLVLLFFLAAGLSVSLNFYKGGTLNAMSLMNIYTAWIFLFLMIIIFSVFYQKNLIAHKNNVALKQLLFFSFFLLMLPFVGAIGTANVITFNLTQYMAAWFGFMILSLFFLSYLYNNRWILLSGSLIIGVFACSQIISSGFIAPYNLNRTIQYQTVPTAVGFPPTYLKLDTATSEFINNIREISKKNGFKPGDDILTFGNMPGVVFFLGGRSPVVPWYFATKEINEWLIQQTSSKRIKNAFILQNESGVANMPDLKIVGINFPEDYVSCGEVIWPLTGEWVRLWKPRG